VFDTPQLPACYHPETTVRSQVTLWTAYNQLFNQSINQSINRSMTLCKTLSKANSFHKTSENTARRVTRSKLFSLQLNVSSKLLINVPVDCKAERGVGVSHVSHKQDTWLHVFDWSCWKCDFIGKVKNGPHSKRTNRNHKLFSLSRAHHFMHVILHGRTTKLYVKGFKKARGVCSNSSLLKLFVKICHIFHMGSHLPPKWPNICAWWDIYWHTINE